MLQCDDELPRQTRGMRTAILLFICQRMPPFYDLNNKLIIASDSSVYLAQKPCVWAPAYLGRNSKEIQNRGHVIYAHPAISATTLTQEFA